LCVFERAIDLERLVCDVEIGPTQGECFPAAHARESQNASYFEQRRSAEALNQCRYLILIESLTDFGIARTRALAAGRVGGNQFAIHCGLQATLQAGGDMVSCPRRQRRHLSVEQIDFVRLDLLQRPIA
jgi:hypothetical protein